MTELPDHYATLGLACRCTANDIREAYRLLAKLHHPDRHGGSAEAVARTQELNAAYETLGDPDRRREYDEARAAARPRGGRRGVRSAPAITQEVQLRLEEFFRGTSLAVTVNDAGNPSGAETYSLDVPPGTAPGTRFRLRREAAPGGGILVVRVRARPDFRFKVRGSDLKADLRITAQRAKQGGTEWVASATGGKQRVEIPAGIARGETLRLDGEGLPKPRGGRGDLLVRVMYRPEVTIRRR